MTASEGGVMEKSQIYEELTKAYFSDSMHERKTIEALPELLADAKLFVDIGASLGQYTYFASQAIKAGRIVAIEPDPIRYAKLREDAASWSRSSSNQIDVIHGVASDVQGKVPFFVTNSAVSGGLFRNELPHLDTARREAVHWDEIAVESHTLDELFSNDLPDCVKMDVEGAELRVLKGATKLLAKQKTIFLIELHDFSDPKGQQSRQDVLNFMTAHGYSAYPFHDKTLFAHSLRERRPLLWAKLQPPKLMNKAKSAAKRVLMLSGYRRK